MNGEVKEGKLNGDVIKLIKRDSFIFERSSGVFQQTSECCVYQRWSGPRKSYPVLKTFPCIVNQMFHNVWERILDVVVSRRFLCVQNS